jgi:hypothetical protein
VVVRDILDSGATTRTENCVIELGELIGELRRELQQAMAAGVGEPLRFELGPVELEATVVVERGGGGNLKVRFWVVEAGGDGKVNEATTQRIKLVLQPRVGATGDNPLISGDAEPDER